MDATTQKRIEEIRQRLAEYHQHKNDPYCFDLEEIDVVRNLTTNAPDDLAFLLALQCPEIRVELESEDGCSDNLAKVRVYKNDELVAEVIAEHKYLQGVDGDYYDRIVIKKVSVEKDKSKQINKDALMFGFFTTEENSDADQVKTFYNPHPGFIGAGIPMPAAVKKVAKDLAGKTLPLNQAVAMIQAATSGIVSVEDGWISLELHGNNGIMHMFRVIRFK